MKKSLIALATLAATASFAQSSVSISGTIDLGINQIDYKGQKVTTTGAANGSATSAVVIAGTEDIGGGVKAEFRWELDPLFDQTSNRTAGTSATGTTSNVTTSIGNGASFVGASGAFGAVKFGTPNLATLTINGEGNGGFATAIGSGYRVSSFDAVRWQNSMRYDTPDFNGFSGSLVYSAKNDQQKATTSLALSGNLNNQWSGRDEGQEIGLNYVNGPLAVRYAGIRMKQYSSVLGTVDPYTTSVVINPANPGAAFKIDSLSAKYSGVVPGLNLSYFYQKVSSDALTVANAAGTAASTSTFDRTTNGVAASYAITPALTAMVNYQQVKNGDAAVSTGTARPGEKATVTGLGLDYALSKRTALYARYERDADSATAKFRSISSANYSGTGTTYTATAVGIRHTF